MATIVRAWAEASSPRLWAAAPALSAFRSMWSMGATLAAPGGSVKRNLRPVASTGMILDGVAASEAIDSSGEVLKVDGCDISSLDKDGVFVYEHIPSDSKEKSGYGLEVVGKILYAHKVLREEDCENERQRHFWEKVG